MISADALFMERLSFSREDWKLQFAHTAQLAENNQLDILVNRINQESLFQSIQKLPGSPVIGQTLPSSLAQ